MAHMQWRLRTALLCGALGLKCCFSLQAPITGRGASQCYKLSAAASEPPATPLPTGATAEILPKEAAKARTETGLLSAEIPLAKLLARAPKRLQTYWARNWARLAILGCALTYGTNFAAVKQLDHSLPPSLSASLRFGLASMAAMTVLWDVRAWDWEYYLLLFFQSLLKFEYQLSNNLLKDSFLKLY